MKFYEKYESWRKMIPMFENRTENSIKNRFFSQLRKIVVKKRPPNGKKEYGTKYGLDTLKKYLDEGIEEAEKRYYEENKNMTKADFENYMIQIEDLIKKRKKGEKFIDMKSLKGKGLKRKKTIKNIINIDEDKEDKSGEISDEDNEEYIEAINNINKRRNKKQGKKNIFKTITNSDEDNLTREETTNLKELMQFGKKKSKSKKIEYTPPIEEKEELDITKDQNEITIEKKNSKRDIEHIINNEDNKRITRQNSKLIEQKYSKVNTNTNINNYNNDNFQAPISYNDFHIGSMPKPGEYSRTNSLQLNENDDNNYYEKEKRKYERKPIINNKTSTNIKKAMKGKFMKLDSFGYSRDIQFKYL
jgi:hypothetical protein